MRVMEREREGEGEGEGGREDINGLLIPPCHVLKMFFIIITHYHNVIHNLHTGPPKTSRLATPKKHRLALKPPLGHVLFKAVGSTSDWTKGFPGIHSH